jgi:4-alpha-glucanotransferase
MSGADVVDQARAGVEPDRRGLALLRRRLLRAAGRSAAATLDDLVDALHRRIAASPSMLVAATLEDALRIEERPNLPGTVSTQRDNWSIALPAPLERILGDRRVLDLVEALRR